MWISAAFFSPTNDLLIVQILEPVLLLSTSLSLAHLSSQSPHEEDIVIPILLKTKVRLTEVPFKEVPCSQEAAEPVLKSRTP